MAELQKYTRRANCPFVFPSPTGNREQHMLDHCKAIARRAGLDPAKFHLKTFRSTFATRMLRKGFDVRTVQHWMGHKSLETTMRYLVPATDCTAAWMKWAYPVSHRLSRHGSEPLRNRFRLNTDHASSEYPRNWIHMGVGQNQVPAPGRGKYSRIFVPGMHQPSSTASHRSCSVCWRSTLLATGSVIHRLTVFTHLDRKTWIYLSDSRRSMVTIT
jgi:hypothetical protein